MGVQKSVSDFCLPLFGVGLFSSGGPISNKEEAFESIKLSSWSFIIWKQLGVGVIPATVGKACAPPVCGRALPSHIAVSLEVFLLGGSILFGGGLVAPLVVFAQTP